MWGNGGIRTATSVALVGVALGGTCGTALAQQAPGAKAELIGGAAERTLALSPCDRSKTPAKQTRYEAIAAGHCVGEKPSLVGTVALLFVNTGEETPVKIRYVRQGRGKSERVPPIAKNPSQEAAVVGTAEGQRLTLPPTRAKNLRLRFLLPAKRQMASLEGMLLIRVGRLKLTIPIKPEIAPPAGVRFEHSKLTFQVTNPKKPEKKVALIGAGVPALLRSRPRESTAMLLDADGSELRVKLSLPEEPDSTADPYRATATLSLVDDPDPGTYTGSVPLESLSGEPKLEVEANARSSPFLAFVLVAIGFFVSAVLSPFFTLGRRRRRLFDELDRAVGEYEKHRAERAPATWDANTILGEVEDLKTSILGARTSTDLDDDTDRVLAIVARLQRWLRLEPATRRLQVVANRKPKGSLSGRQFASSRALHDVRLLLRAAKREPPDGAAADDLAARLLHTTTWHHVFVRAWAEAAAKDTALQDAVLTLDAKLAEKGVLERTATERDELDLELDAVIAAIQPPDVPKVPVLDVSEEPDWDAEPSLFRGWATMGGDEFAQFAAQSRATTRGGKKAKWWELLWRSRPKHLGDWLLSIAIVLVSALIYLTTIYDSDWGTWQDWVTAATAGIAGSAAVKGALPVLQSLRLRASGGGAS